MSISYQALTFGCCRRIWQIELFSFPDPPERPSYPEACGLRHLAFSVADLDHDVAELIRKGISIEPIRRDELTGKRFAFFADPDGLPIELTDREIYFASLLLKRPSATMWRRAK
ncbi:MAG: VOC family protein [Luteolibacter sp.]